MSSVEATFTAIEFLEPGEKMNYTQIAKIYGVERSTLNRRHRGRTTSREASSQMQLSLHPQQELGLLRYIERLTMRGLKQVFDWGTKGKGTIFLPITYL